MIHRAARWQHLGIFLLVLVTLIMHFSTITQPGEPAFDEQHYVPDAKSIIEGEGTLRGEHPPLAKLFISLGIRIFGDNAFGWRFFSVLFGTASLVLFYLICRQLSLSQRVTLLATSLLAFENLTFIQASVAMLDVYSLTFMLLSFLLYLKGRYLVSGMSVGLATLAKLSGGAAVLVIALHWLVTRRKILQGLVFSVAALASFFLLMPLFDLVVFRHLVSPFARLRTMIDLTGSLTFADTTTGIPSRPWEWIIGPPQSVDYWYTPRYVGEISFTIWALIIPAMLYAALRAVKGVAFSWFVLCWFAGTYLVWIPLNLITDRLTFVFYFYPTVGAISIALALGLSDLWDRWRGKGRGWLRRIMPAAALGFVLLHLVLFFVLHFPLTSIV
ncbi:MAG: glycosyltransferase family 39 protein [Dehalococcoidia bacterium]